LGCILVQININYSVWTRTVSRDGDRILVTYKGFLYMLFFHGTLTSSHFVFVFYELYRFSFMTVCQVLWFFCSFVINLVAKLTIYLYIKMLMRIENLNFERWKLHGNRLLLLIKDGSRLLDVVYLASKERKVFFNCFDIKLLNFKLYIE